MTDRIGQQMGSYRLQRLIGRGGFSEVYLGEHIYLKTQVAIKVLQAVAEDAQEAFLKEARTIASLVHPNIVRVLDFGLSGDDFTPFLVMDYASRGTLRQHFTRGARLPLEKIVHYIKQAASALQYAHHMNIIHRDVKPENMLLGVDDQLLLSDFGIAVVARNSLPNVQEIVGTVQYMAPEQFEGMPRPASDQYALGLIVYEWLCGTSLVQGSFSEVAMQRLLVSPVPPSKREPTIPATVDAIVLKSLARDPGERFPSIQMFADALEEVSKEGQKWGEGEAITLTKEETKRAEETITSSDFAWEKTQKQNQTTLPPAQQTCPCGTLTDLKAAFCLNCGASLAGVSFNADKTDLSINLDASVAGSSILGSFMRPAIGKSQPEGAEKYQIAGNEAESLQEAPYDDNATVLMPDESLANFQVLSSATSPQVLLEVGDKYFEEKRYEESLALYEHVLQVDSQNIIAYLNKGRVLLALEKYEEAILAYDGALRLVPTDANLWIAKGKLYSQLRQHKNALDAYEHAVRFAPEDAAIWASKGEILWRLRRYDDALVSYDRALELLPTEMANWISKGQLLIKLKHYEKALEVYTYVLSVSSNDGRMWAIKGNILSRMERYEEALLDYNRALATFPKRASIWEARGEALSHLERYEEALFSFERALAFKPQDSSINHKRDMVYQLKCNKEELALKEKLSKAQADEQMETRIGSLGGRQADLTLLTSLGESKSASHESSNIDDPDYYDVFLSHSHVDAEWVETVLARRLEDEHQLRVWLDKWVLIPGQSWQQDMARGLHSARACAVCIGENTPLGWFREEIERALDRQSKFPSFRVIPVLLPNAKTVNVDNFLELRTRVDFRTTDYDQAFYLLVCGVKGIRPGRPQTEKTTAKSGPITEDMLQELKDFKQKGLLAETIAEDYTRIIMEKVWIPHWFKEEDTHE